MSIDCINTTENLSSDNRIDIQNIDGIKYMESIDDGTVDLILTDPPYIISRSTGMDTHYNNVKKNEENNVFLVKTENEWKEYKLQHSITDDSKKELYKLISWYLVIHSKS